MWNLKKYSNNVAVIKENGESITYAQLEEMCNELTLKIGERSLIFNFSSNTIGALVGYVGSIISKNVPLMLDQDIAKELADNFIEIYSPDYLWLPEDKSNNYNGEVVYSAHDYVLLKPNMKKVTLFEELALLLSTSGSTGSPKLVRQSYKNLKSNTVSILEYLKISEKDRAITTLPMNYTYGLSIINTHLAVGGSIILTTKSLMQREFWDIFSELEATSIAGVPYTYEILDKLRFFTRNLPSLRTMTQAGGKLLPALHEKFAKFANETGKEFVVMYGQTEATARMAYLPAEKSLEKFGSMGVAIPHGKLSLTDGNGNEIIEANIVGELLYEGENVMLGYAENTVDLSKGDELHGRLVTGDMAKRDEDGFYYIVGRKKRFLKIFGNRVNLDETERLVKDHFENLDCACGGKDDLMKIFITDENKLKEVQKFISEKIHIHFSAFKVQYLKKIPKNDSGKTLYSELED